MAATRTAKGTNKTKTGVDPWTALTAISIVQGASIIVYVAVKNNGTPTGVTWNGLALTLDDSEQNADAAPLNASVWSRHNNTSATGDVVIDFINSSWDVAAMAAIQVEGLLSSPVDKVSSSFGTSASPSSGATATTTQNNEFLAGFVATNGPVGDAAGTWGSDTTNNGQRDGTTGGSAGSNAVVSEGWGNQTVTGARTASKSGITSRAWLCIIVTYKEAEAGTPLTVSISDTINNWADSLTGMGRGYALEDTINNWAERQDIGLGLIFADNMNNLLDAILVRLSYEIGLSDNAGNLADAIETQFVGAYGIAASDTVDNWSDALSGMGRGYSFEDTLALSDEIKLILDHLLSFSDTLVLSDGTEIRLGYLKDFTDNLNSWLDAIQTSLAGFQEAAVADSMENWGDSINVIYGYLKDISDDLNNFVDAISLLFEYRLQLSDTMTLSDAIAIEEGLLLFLSDNLQNWTDEQQLRLNYLLSIPDDLNSWTEFILVNLSYELSLTDSINNWTDFVNTVLGAPSLGVSRNVSDTLNFWKDRAEISTSLQRLGIRDYLRRYLNDVIVADPVVLISTTPHGVFKPDVHTYLRRYLNDVSPEYLVHQMDNLNNWKDIVSANLV